jgi:hypothetical protein
MIRLLFISIISLAMVHLFEDSDWNLKKDKSDIEIYTRSVDGSSFDEFKGITVIPKSSLSDVLEVVLNVANYHNLFPDCVNAEILKKEGKYYDVHYVEVKAPWPVQARDAIYEQKTVVSADGKHARVSLLPLPDFAAEKKDLVRIQEGTGFWELEEDSNHNVMVIYQFHGEPAGKIPAWLANSFVVSHPFKTLQNLKSSIKNSIIVNN